MVGEPGDAAKMAIAQGVNAGLSPGVWGRALGAPPTRDPSDEERQAIDLVGRAYRLRSVIRSMYQGGAKIALRWRLRHEDWYTIVKHLSPTDFGPGPEPKLWGLPVERVGDNGGVELGNPEIAVSFDGVR